MTLAPGRHRSPAFRCQHCERDIWLSEDDVWADSDGIGVCILLAPAAPGDHWEHIPHKPMPKAE